MGQRAKAYETYREAAVKGRWNKDFFFLLCISVFTSPMYCLLMADLCVVKIQGYREAQSEGPKLSRSDETIIYDLKQDTPIAMVIGSRQN